MGVLLGGGKATKPIKYSALQVGSSQYDLPIPIFWGQRRLGTNAIDCEDFERHSVSAGGKGGGKSDQYDYTGAVILALCEGTIDGIVNAWAQGSTTTTTTLDKLKLTLFNGTASQVPWSYMTSKHPTKARAYPYTAYLTCEKMDFGSSATIPDNAFECVRAAGFAYTAASDGYKNPTTGAVTSAIDVLFSDAIFDLLTNSQYGMAGPSADIGDMTALAAYHRAQGLVFSPLLNLQEKCTAVIDRYAQLGNFWAYWSGTQYQFVPLGDSAITANGATYIPDVTPAYDLSLANGDFLDASQPVKVTRKDPADCSNRTVLQITDRTLGYVTNPLEYKDQTLVDQYGTRDNASVSADEICNPAVGQIVAQLVGKRAAYMRKTYAFKSPRRYLRCVPGTLLTLTEPNEELNLEPVRVTSVKRAADGTLSFTCEEFPGNVGTYVATGALPAPATPTFPNQYIDPGNVNTPAVVEPTSDLTNGVPSLIVAASGGSNWGGCQVFLSFDGVNYTPAPIGTITAEAGQGLLTANLASGSDPDTTNTLSVDTTESDVPLGPVTHADADALRTLAFISPQPAPSGGSEVLSSAGELIAYGTVATTSSWGADLTYLRRGKYGTAIAAHSTGDQFSVIDVSGALGSSVVYPLPQQYVGQPIYFKFCSFNIFGPSAGVQDQSVVTEYVYTPSGIGFGGGSGGVPTAPSAPAVSASSTSVALSWPANPTADHVTSYTLSRANGTGAAFGSATSIWSGLATHYTDNSVSASSGYTYFLVANNAAGASSPSAGANATTGAATTTVSALPSGTAGERNFVTDSTVSAAGNFGAAVAGGGSHDVPVFFDGTAWLIG